MDLKVFFFFFNIEKLGIGDAAAHLLRALGQGDARSSRSGTSLGNEARPCLSLKKKIIL